ncbi:Hypothetical predicted protein [Scomber scombrus]|uniref:Uncharacterized protein n=1 Tax=Scomber scombrus TaxID=13677 RepID=A0AAV1PFI5_SCOSC
MAAGVGLPVRQTSCVTATSHQEVASEYIEFVYQVSRKRQTQEILGVDSSDTEKLKDDWTQIVGSSMCTRWWQ